MVTCRDAFTVGEWNDALKIHTNPFNRRQIKEFVGKWFAAQPTSREGLIEWLEENETMYQAASSPMITALLCSLYRLDGDMPTTESELYDQRFDLLLGTWERAKGIQPLNISIRKRYRMFLMELATMMHKETLRSVGVDVAIDLCKSYYERSYHTSAEEMVRDLIHRGLLYEEVSGKLSFGHLTYQEFMVGKWLSHHNPVQSIARWMDQDWWWQSIRFYAALKGDISVLCESLPASKLKDKDFCKRYQELLNLAPLTPIKSVPLASPKSATFAT
ncbi:MAG: hypothetical protein AAF492_32635 [Verrucomicrobiota bacterium]